MLYRGKQIPEAEDLVVVTTSDEQRLALVLFSKDKAFAAMELSPVEFVELVNSMIDTVAELGMGKIKRTYH
jgi:hypothetical protein